MIRMMCGVGLIDRVLTDILCGRMGWVLLSRLRIWSFKAACGGSDMAWEEDAFDWKKKKNGESEFDKKLLTLASQDNDIKTDVVVVVVDLLILDKSMQMIFHSDNYHFDNWFYFYPLFL